MRDAVEVLAELLRDGTVAFAALRAVHGQCQLASIRDHVVVHVTKVLLRAEALEYICSSLRPGVVTRANACRACFDVAMAVPLFDGQSTLGLRRGGVVQYQLPEDLIVAIGSIQAFPLLSTRKRRTRCKTKWLATDDMECTCVCAREGMAVHGVQGARVQRSICTSSS